MRDVIPTGSTRDSEFLFARMTERALALCQVGSGQRVLDVASGVGQDAHALAQRGAFAVAAEPSARMLGLARLVAPEDASRRAHGVRGWADRLPFATGSFDAVLCKGAIDHFDAPLEAI